MIQQITTYFSEHGAEWVQMVIDHLAISGMALAAALAIAVPLGILCSQHAWSERLATGTAGVLRVIPSLAILIICVPYLGVGTVPAVVALTVLAIPPILINTAVALRSVPTDVIEAGVGMGMSPARLWLTFSGVRTAASEIIASATLAAYIGAGGLGILIYTGLGALRNDLLWIGGISVAVLSLIVNRVLAMVDRRIRTYEHVGSSAR